jgi:hypothetical protein
MHDLRQLRLFQMRLTKVELDALELRLEGVFASQGQRREIDVFKDRSWAIRL